jgi:hypothetical protein
VKKDDLLSQANRILTPPEKKIEVAKASVFDNLEAFLRYRCRLKFGPHGKKAKDGMSEAWFDLRTDSACMKRMKHLTEPLPPGKWGVLILESRGAGKSTGAECTSYGSILDDPTETHVYAAQSIAMAERRVRWVERHIKTSHPKMYNKDDWSHEQFTVIGADPTSDDPTMLAAAPEVDIEGAHAGNYWLDDIVSVKSNATASKRRKQVTWFEAAQKQFTPATVVKAIGTMHKHHNLWTEILDHYEDEFVIFILGCYDEDTGERFYPWMNDEWLANKEKHDPQGFAMSYMNKRVRVDDVVFEDNMFQYGEPMTTPNDKIEGGLQIHPDLNVYMHVDFGQSSRNSEGVCETAFVVLAKDYENNRYIVDAEIGRFESDLAQTKFLNMYRKWIKHGLLFATMEDRGPARSLMTTLPQLAKVSPEYDFIPRIVPLERSNNESKDARIGQMYAEFSRMKFFWSKHFLHPNMFKIDARGRPQGAAYERLHNYAKDGDALKDFPDALADEGHVSGKGPVTPHPRPPKLKKKPMTDYDWSMKRASGQLKKTIFV